jgi:hypothetical protein
MNGPCFAPQFSQPRPSSWFCEKNARAFAFSFDRFCHNGSGTEDRRCGLKRNPRVRKQFGFVNYRSKALKRPLELFLFAGWRPYHSNFQALAGDERRKKRTPPPPGGTEIVTRITSIKPRLKSLGNPDYTCNITSEKSSSKSGRCCHCRTALTTVSN